MPRQSSKPTVPDAPESVEMNTVDELTPEPIVIPADEQVTRFSLDAPPARIAGLPRSQQKPIIMRANVLIATGMDAHEALTEAIGR